jgi:glycosyltransferase involved in cell wall biosynthesis
MRIVIDMQGAQTDNRQCGIGRYTFSLAQAIARNRGTHEVFLALNGLFPETIQFIRAAFDDLLPQKNIRVWYAPGPVRACKSDNNWRLEVAERIREGFLASLQPDIVYISSMFDGYDNDTVMSIGVFASDLLTVVALHDSLINKNHDDFHAVRFQLRKTEYLKRAQFYHLITPLSTADGVRYFDVCADNMIKSKVGIAVSAIEKEFDDEADQLLKQFEKLVENNNPVTVTVNPVQRKRPRLAYVSPLPPERTGIADYSAELLPELARYYDIDVVAAQDQVSDLWVLANCTIRSVDWFQANACQFDRVLYHFGNSHYHQHMFSLLKQIPGVVALHDFFLSGVVSQSDVNGLAPGCWSTELYHSHGYAAVQRRFQVEDLDEVVWEYPCNFSILQYAQGVIIHAEASRRLARQWYGEKISDDWGVIPLLRVPADNFDREQSRKILNLNNKDFVVCSFGMVGISKLNHRLLDCWLASDLAKDKDCVLVFVGENEAGEYGQHLLDKIHKSGVRNRIRITGWSDSSTFRHYLAVADVAVQLRTLSRGETSATVLDCMNYGIPTIVNANGSMADLPDDCVWKMPDVFEDIELVDALEQLWKDSSRREILGKHARKSILIENNPHHCAYQYAQYIERFSETAQSDTHALLKELANLDNHQFSSAECVSLAQSIVRSIPAKYTARTLMLDISATCRNDLKTGIERVVRALIVALIESPPPGFRVEPVYLCNEGGLWHYRYARQYTLELLGCPKETLEDEIAEPIAGDKILGLDFSGEMLVEADRSGLFDQLRGSGVLVYFMVFDLLPILMPEMFPPGSDSSFIKWLKTISRFDGVFCISRTVAEDLVTWLASKGQERKRSFSIKWIHLGADVVNSAPSLGLPSDANEVLVLLAARPSFLMVGTVEPRKGYLQVLETFTKLWDEGVDINLVVVGKEGWQGLPDNQRRVIPEIVQRLRTHPELGKHLFWLEGVSDQYLEEIYGVSTCLIAASEGEGFGLPLVEAAQYKIPIMARDIPVYREVAGQHAFYFSGDAPENLASEVMRWMKMHQEGDYPKSETMPWLNWKESASQLGMLLGDAVYQNSSEHGGEILTLKPRKRIYVDISVVYRDDYKTGIQRVVRAILSEFIKCPPDNYTICPVYLTDSSGTWDYFPVPAYSPGGGEDTPISPCCGDVLLGLDLACGYVIEAFKYDVYRKLMDSGVLVYFVVYDLLPVLAPQFFHTESSKGHEQWMRFICQSDGVICISKSVADEFSEWSRTVDQELQDHFSVKFFHLGGDIEASVPTTGIPENAASILNLLSFRPSFLMVGTVEPRKGHKQALEAFEKLWKQGLEANLVIVGNQGWKIKSLEHRLLRNPELGKRLFWLKGISDEYLEKIYAASTCLIAASECEGFGLPLIEAAQHKKPIIARDIPVFREVAAEHAYYFNGLEPEALAVCVKDWLALHAKGKAPRSDNMPWLTWQESAQQLLSKILPEQLTKLND